jgi:hypothetical protein
VRGVVRSAHTWGVALLQRFSVVRNEMCGVIVRREVTESGDLQPRKGLGAGLA